MNLCSPVNWFLLTFLCSELSFCFSLRMSFFSLPLYFCFTFLSSSSVLPSSGSTHSFMSPLYRFPLCLSQHPLPSLCGSVPQYLCTNIFIIHHISYKSHDAQQLLYSLTYIRWEIQHMLVLIKSIPVPKISAVRVNLGICPLLCSQSACFLLKLEELGIQIFHINFIILW